MYKELEKAHPEVFELLTDMADIINEEVPPGWGFALFLFQFDPGKATFFASSGVRANVIEAMREWVKRQDTLPESENWRGNF